MIGNTLVFLPRVLRWGRLNRQKRIKKYPIRYCNGGYMIPCKCQTVRFAQKMKLNYEFKKSYMSREDLR